MNVNYLLLVLYSLTIMLDTVEIEPPQPATASIIWLHGLGADGHDFEAIVPELKLPKDAAIRFIFPHAPVRAVTINGGMNMRAWYDITGIGQEYPDDAQGIGESEDQIITLIEKELARGIPANRIILAGFSQGGVIALHTGLRYGKALAGIMVLSGYLPLADSLEQEASKANQQTPILMLHGDYDQVVPVGLADESQRRLSEQGYRVEWQVFPMEHSVNFEELNVIRAWIVKTLGSS
jgi:phospholipase/carboxylesterase